MAIGLPPAYRHQLNMESFSTEAVLAPAAGVLSHWGTNKRKGIAFWRVPETLGKKAPSAHWAQKYEGLEVGFSAGSKAACSFIAKPLPHSPTD